MTARFYITAETLFDAVRHLPATSIWMDLDPENGTVQLHGADKFYSVLSSTRRQVVAEGDKPEFVVKFLDVTSLYDLLKSIVDDAAGESVTLDITYPEDKDEPKLKLKWKIQKKNRTATIHYARDTVPAPIVFNHAEAIQLLADDRKVLQAHGEIARNASDDKHAGVLIQYHWEPDEATVKLTSTDTFRVLHNTLHPISATVQASHTIALPDTAIPPLVKMHADLLWLDLENATWEVTIGNDAYLVRTITKNDLKEIDVNKFLNISRIPANPELRDREELTSYHTAETNVEGRRLEFVCVLASKLTISTKTIYLRAEGTNIIATTVANETGAAKAIQPATGNAIGRPGTVPLSYRLLRTALDLMGKDTVVHCVLNPVGPNVFEWDSTAFVIMPMIVKTSDDEEEDEDEETSAD